MKELQEKNFCSVDETISNMFPEEILGSKADDKIQKPEHRISILKLDTI